MSIPPLTVMAGLVPATYAVPFLTGSRKTLAIADPILARPGVDGRDKPGHDEEETIGRRMPSIGSSGSRP
jgi:hypothetical protein